MKKAILFLAAIIIIPFLTSQKPPKNGDKPYVEGQVMVKLRSDVTPARSQEMLKEFIADFGYLNLQEAEKLSHRMNIYLLHFTPKILSDKMVLDQIREHPAVELAQFNHFIEQREFIPSDQYFGLQWNMHNTGQTGGTDDADIDGPEAWELGNSGITATGDTIIVAIVDDGFDIDHEDLAFWKNYLEIPGNSIDDDSNGYVDDYDGWNAWSNSGNIIERDHGTHVTGIACAQGDNDRGVAGVNLHVKALPVVGSATVESIVVAAYGYLHEMRSLYNETGGEKGAFIVSNNCSFGVNNGQPEDYPIWGAMYDSLGALGILSAAATANADWDIDEVGDIPTAFTSEWLLTVTNTDDDDHKNTSAAYGDTTIDLGAPGTQIYSTRQGNQYGYKTGCSMSAPHVTGAVAYLYSIADEAFMEAYHNDPGGMALVIRQCLLNGVDPVASLDGKTVTGGRLNIFNAAQLLLNPDVAFEPMSILKVMLSGQQDSVPLSFTNHSGAVINYTMTYPDTLSWISLTGMVFGALNAGDSGSVMVHFDSDGLAGDTLFTYLDFNYGDDSKFMVPVQLFVVPEINQVTVNITGGPATICPGENVTLTAQAAGGSGGYTYSWTSIPAGFTSAEPVITVSPEVTTTYFLEVSDSGGSTDTDSFVVTVNQFPGKPEITSGPASVDNFTATLSTYNCTESTNATSYQWSVIPEEAGTTSSIGTEGKILWSNEFTGTVMISVTGVNDCGEGPISEAFITVIYSSAGLEENDSGSRIIIYPNPAKEVLRFKVSGLSAGNDYHLFVFNATGEQVLEIKSAGRQDEWILDLSSYQPGIYFAVIKDGNQPIATKRFILTN